MIGSTLSVFAKGSLDIGGAVLTGYDDNITYASSSEAADMVTKAYVGALFKYEQKNYFMSLSGRLTQNIFSKYHSFNNLAQDLSLDGSLDLSERDNITFKDKFSHSEDPRSFQDSFGRTQGRYEAFRHSLETAYSKAVNEQIKVKLNYRQADDFFSRQDIRDSSEYSPGFASEYALNSSTKVVTGYDYARRIFVTDEFTDTHNPYVGMEHYLTKQWYLNLKVGETFVRSFNGSWFDRPRYEAGITDDVDENTKFNLTYIKEYNVNPYSVDIFSSWRLVMTLNKQLSSRLRSHIAAFHGKGEYRMTVRSSELSGINLGMEYALNPYSSVLLGYAYEHTNSNIDTSDYTRNFIQSGIKLSF